MSKHLNSLVGRGYKEKESKIEHLFAKRGSSRTKSNKRFKFKKQSDLEDASVLELSKLRYGQHLLDDPEGGDNACFLKEELDIHRETDSSARYGGLGV